MENCTLSKLAVHSGRFNSNVKAQLKVVASASHKLFKANGLQVYSLESSGVYNPKFVFFMEDLNLGPFHLSAAPSKRFRVETYLVSKDHPENGCEIAFWNNINENKLCTLTLSFLNAEKYDILKDVEEFYDYVTKYLEP